MVVCAAFCCVPRVTACILTVVASVSKWMLRSGADYSLALFSIVSVGVSELIFNFGVTN